MGRMQPALPPSTWGCEAERKQSKAHNAPSPKGQQMVPLCNGRGSLGQAPNGPTQDGSLALHHQLTLGHQLSLDWDVPWGVKDGHADDFLHSRVEDRAVIK